MGQEELLSRCTTVGDAGEGAGYECIFGKAKYKGVSYEACIPNDNGGVPWCYVRVEGDVGSNWANCAEPPACPESATCGDADGVYPADKHVDCPKGFDYNPAMSEQGCVNMVCNTTSIDKPDAKMC